MHEGEGRITRMMNWWGVASQAIISMRTELQTNYMQNTQLHCQLVEDFFRKRLTPISVATEIRTKNEEPQDHNSFLVVCY
jgi:hypothetical protein